MVTPSGWFSGVLQLKGRPTRCPAGRQPSVRWEGLCLEGRGRVGMERRLSSSNCMRWEVPSSLSCMEGLGWLTSADHRRSLQHDGCMWLFRCMGVGGWWMCTVSQALSTALDPVMVHFLQVTILRPRELEKPTPVTQQESQEL